MMDNAEEMQAMVELHRNKDFSVFVQSPKLQEDCLEKTFSFHSASYYAGVWYLSQPYHSELVQQQPGLPRDNIIGVVQLYRETCIR